MTPEQRANALIAVCGPLLELFAVVNDVFTEDDALMATKRKMSLGRIYEQWKRTRDAMDPDFRDPHLKTKKATLLDAARAHDQASDRAARRHVRRAAREGQFS
jgi:hypothetical protein